MIFAAFAVKGRRLFRNFHFRRFTKIPEFRNGAKRLLHHFPLLRFHRLCKPVNQNLVVLKNFRVSRYAVSIGLLGKIRRSVMARPQFPPNRPYQKRIPFGFFHRIVLQKACVFSPMIKPILRLRLTLRKIIQFQYHGIKIFIVAIRTVMAGKTQKCLILFFIHSLKQFPDDALPHQFPFLLIDKAEFRIDVRHSKIFPNQSLTKSVHRRNRSVWKQNELARYFRMTLNFIHQFFLNAFTHFHCRRVCKSYNQQLVNTIFPIFNILDNPFY